MKIKKSKRGFTLTELAIVIAVIAILIAILVPTFVSLINKANNSSDEQTVKNLNTALSIDEAEGSQPEYLCQVWDILKDAGYNPAPTPNYSDNEFYWYKSVNRVVIVSVSQSEILFPSEYAGITVTDDTSASISLRLTAAKATAESINKSALVSLSVDEDDPSAHCYDAGTVTKESTCTEDGEIVYYCSACDGTKTEVIEAAHSYGDTVTKDYVTEDGEVYTDGKIQICSVCNEYTVITEGTKDSENGYTWDGDPLESKYVYEGTTLVAYYIPDSEYEYNGEIKIEVPYGTTAIDYPSDYKNKGFDAYDEDGDNVDYAVFSQAVLGMYITEITLPDTLTYIGGFCFNGQSKLTSITIPAAVTYIGPYAFTTNANYNTEVEIIFEDGSCLDTIDAYAFYHCNLSYIVIPSTVSTIGESAFFGTYSNFKSIYYCGTASDWNSITTSYTANNILVASSTYATLYYYSETEPTESGNYWHYNAEGVPEIWDS